MAVLTNGGFETAGATPGSAASWTLTTSTSVSEFADYLYDATSNRVAVEAFEGRWSSNEAYAFDLGVSTPATYFTLSATPKQAEDFEEGWLSNQGYLFGFAGEAGSYDTTPELFEDFNEEWASNESYAYSFVGAAGTFDASAPEAFEDFAEEWRSNETYAFTFTGTAANYDTTPEAAEDFEEEWPAVVLTTI